MLAEIIPSIAGLDQRKFKYNPRPSSSGPERCIRSMVYNALGIEPKALPGRSILTMDDSTWHETLSIDWINKSAYRLHSNQMGIDCLELKSQFLDKEWYCKACKRTIPRHMLHGHIDGILQEPEELEHLFEHKAINHFTFQAYESGDLIPYDYVAQVVIYYVGLKKILQKDLSFSILFVKNKNTAQYMEFHIEYDEQTDIAKIESYRVEYNNDGFPQIKFIKESFMEKVIAGTIEKYLLIDKYVNENTLPKRQYGIDSWRCEYCGWNEYCWKDYGKEMEERKESIKVDDEIFGDIQIYYAIDKEMKSNEKQLKVLKQKIKLYLINENAKYGLAGDCTAILSTKTKKSLNKDLISAEIIEQATVKTTYEELKIRNKKDKEGEE